MSTEKNKEERKEQIMKANALSDEELEKVSGGGGETIVQTGGAPNNVTNVSADSTTCLYAGWVNSYDPIDINKPQTCGNCRNYFEDECMRRKGG